MAAGRLILLVLVAMLALVVPATGQHSIEGTVTGAGNTRVYLLSIYGERTRAIDSATTGPDGRFRFEIGSSRLPGVYRVRWNKDSSVDLIWNEEDVAFVTRSEEPDDSLIILKSAENRIYRAWSLMDRANQSKLQLLIPVVDFYPDRDDFYKSVADQFERIQQNQMRFLDSVASVHPASFAVRMARTSQPPFLPAAMGKDERIGYLRQHYFDRVDFNDTALLRSMVFVNKAVSYLSLYSNNRLTQKQLEAEFIRAVTVMLGAASVNPVIYKFWLDYLVGGFDKYHFEDVITYIAENFQDPSSCEDAERKSALQKKLDTFRKIAIGKPAPALEVPDSTGTVVRLSELDAEYTLLVYYATTCPHCMQMMPRLRELYLAQQPRRFEVVAISIDTERQEWTRFIRDNRAGWIDVSDLKGFAGKSADDYNIYATPTMFLLDRGKTIVSKPISLMELEQALRDHNLIR